MDIFSYQVHETSSHLTNLKLVFINIGKIWQDTKVYIHSILSTYSIMSCHACHKQSLSKFLSALNLKNGPFYCFHFLFSLTIKYFLKF